MGWWDKVVEKAQDIVCGDDGENLTQEIAKESKKRKDDK